MNKSQISQLDIKDARMQREIKYHLKTPAYENGTTTSPWRDKIQRIGLLNITYKSMVKSSDISIKKKKGK